MNRLALPIALLLFSFASAGDNETKSFLGPETDWLSARLELKNVHGSVGGEAIAVSGSGSACVRLMDKSMNEKRWAFTLERDEALALLRLAVEQDFLAQKPKPRVGAPGELRTELILENALGMKRSILRWQKDSIPALEKIEAALRSLEKKCEGKEPTFSGKFAPFYQPLPAVHVTILLYKGRPDPSFELVRPEDWEKLRSLLAGLAAAEKPEEKPPLSGFRGFGLLPRDVPGLPRSLNVFRGSVKRNDDPTKPSYEKDEKGLEEWLKDEAKKRGIEIPK
jgi:hypothetical protein